MNISDSDLPNLQTFAALCTKAALVDPVKTLLATALGADDATQAIVVANVAEADWKSLANTQLRVQTGSSGDRALTIVERSQVGLVWTVAQYAIKALPTVEERAKLEKEKRDHEVAIAKAGGAPPPGAATSSSTALAIPAAQRTFAAECVTDQSDKKTEFKSLSQQEIMQAYKVYNDKLGSGHSSAPPVVPHPDEEPTVEQLSAIKALVESGSPPYVDFAIFGPHANRLKKKIAMSGYTMARDGTFQLTELKGPSNFVEWKECYCIFRTCCIMLEVCSPAVLDKYCDHISRFNLKYSDAVWLILYQTDVRARSEQVERIRRRGAQEHSAATGTGGTHEYQPSQPWEFVYRHLVLDNKFWEDEFTSTALLIRSHIDRLTEHLGPEVEGDTRSSRPSGSSQKRGSDPGHEPPPSPPGTKRKKGDKKGGAEGSRKGPDGFYTSNRSGTPLCRAYQDGSCKEHTYVQGLPMCARNKKLAHMCAKCLGRHPAYPEGGEQCSAKDSNRSLAIADGKGKGRGGRGPRR